MEFIMFFVALIASIIGAICGVGGGVVIKPVLDTLRVASVSTISFMSAATVLSMSLCSVIGTAFSKDKDEQALNFKRTTPLGIGAVVGGISGKLLFEYLKGLFSDPEQVGVIQATFLAVVLAVLLAYTLKRDKIKTHNIESKAVSVLVGISLGIISSFLGIGGGPVDVVALFFLFSMDAKAAAANSLYIIFLSQAANIAFSLITGNMPAVKPIQLMLMIAGGILGAVVGRKINKKIASQTVNRLFIALLICMMLVSVYNVIKTI